MRYYEYAAVVFPKEDEDSEYEVAFPDLDISTCARTIEECYCAASELLELYLTGKLEDTSDLPEATLDITKLLDKYTDEDHFPFAYLMITVRA